MLLLLSTFDFSLYWSPGNNVRRQQNSETLVLLMSVDRFYLTFDNRATTFRCFEIKEGDKKWLPAILLIPPFPSVTTMLSLTCSLLLSHFYYTPLASFRSSLGPRFPKCVGDFDLNDNPRSWRLNEVDDVIIKTLVESDPRDTKLEIAETLNIQDLNVNARYLCSS